MNWTRISSSRVQVKTAEKNLMCFDGPNTKFKTSCLMMDPLRFENLGPSKDMSFLCTHVFRWTQKPHVFWWTQKIIKGPLKDMRFGSIKRHKVWVEKWVHQKTWGFRGENFENICTNWVHQKTWDFERGKSWFGSIKRHEVFGSIKRHEVVKNGQNSVGSIKRHEYQNTCQKPRTQSTEVLSDEDVHAGPRPVSPKSTSELTREWKNKPWRKHIKKEV